MVKTNNIDKFNRVRKEKNIVTGDCIFPFKYKGVLHNKCVAGNTGNWCATSIKPTKTSKTWAYCVKSKKKQYESEDDFDQEEQTTKPFNTNNKRKKRLAKKNR